MQQRLPHVPTIKPAIIKDLQRISARTNGNELNPIDVGGFFWTEQSINKNGCDGESATISQAPQSDTVSKIINHYDTPSFSARRTHVETANYPDDQSMRISHEAIYQALYIQGRGALRRELTACLRSGRALRVPRARTQQRGRHFVTPEVMISERPAEIADRAVPGHWEGDLIIGLNRSAICTLVERTTRFTMLLHLPPMEGHGVGVRAKNGPALAGHGAEAVRNAIATKIALLPENLRRSLTWVPWTVSDGFRWPRPSMALTPPQSRFGTSH